MRTLFVCALSLLAFALPAAAQEQRWSIVIHGGAGVIERGRLDAETEARYRAALTQALEAGAAVLERGGSAMDAVEAAIVLMEDDPLFNAGRGAVFTAEGRNELDASVMDGATRQAGAVAGVTRTRHPISLARAVMTHSPHVMLIGEGAETFARAQNLEEVAPSYFFTARRWRMLEDFLARQGLPVPPRPAGARDDGALLLDDHQFGTVGVVAYDVRGDLAAGTSTGGTNGKRWGRVGDTPVIGAGTYAQNGVCAVSGTGTGEFFIRLSVARRICDLIELRGRSVQQAADDVVQIELRQIGGDGGIIALGGDGTPAWSMNTSGMYRARMRQGEAPVVRIFADEDQE